MSNIVDATKLAVLGMALPARIHAAAQAILVAEQRLAYILILRAAGQLLKPSEISVARMALARAQRDHEDLQTIQRVLPNLLDHACESHQTEPKADVT